MKTRKITLLAFLILITNFTIAQKISELDTLYVDNIKVEDLKAYKNKVEIKNLVLSDNSIISNGSNLIIGDPSNPVNVNSNVYNGVKVSNTTIDFTYVYVDKYSLMSAMAAVAFSAEQKGTEIVVSDILMHKSGKRYSFVVNFVKKDGTNVAMGKYGNIRSLIDALQTGEVINPNRAMTREEAIAKLKESKDLFNLEMMTLEEYEKIKKELAPIIKGE